MLEFPSPSSDPPRAWWRWLNWLSLDAVAVAVSWSFVFARMTGARLQTVEIVGLAAGVWLVYMADRLLDAGTGHGRAERHRFAGKNRLWLLPVMLAAGAGAVWWALHAMRWITLQVGLWLGAAVAAYFVMILTSRRQGVSRISLVAVSGLMVLGLVQGEGLSPTGVPLWRAAIMGAMATVLYTGLRCQSAPPPWILTKKAVGGYLFALGAAAAPFSHLQDWPGLLHGTPVMLFASACALNSMGIRLWENEASADPEIVMLRRLYPWLLAVVGGGALAEAWAVDEWTRPVLIGVAGCVAGFAILHALRLRLPASAGALAADGLMVGAAVLVRWAGMRG